MSILEALIATNTGDCGTEYVLIILFIVNVNKKLTDNNDCVGKVIWHPVCVCLTGELLFVNSVSYWAEEKCKCCIRCSSSKDDSCTIQPLYTSRFSRTAN